MASGQASCENLREGAALLLPHHTITPTTLQHIGLRRHQTWATIHHSRGCAATKRGLLFIKFAISRFTNICQNQQLQPKMSGGA